MFRKNWVVAGGATLALVLAAAPLMAQWGPGQQGPNWDRRGSYYNSSPYATTVAQPVVAAAPVASQSSFSNASQERSVRIQMRVPENARVWFDNTQTQQQGADRQFISPALPQGENYSYQVRVQWNDNGEMKDQTRTVTVRAGDRINLEFGQAQR